MSNDFGNEDVPAEITAGLDTIEETKEPVGALDGMTAKFAEGLV